MLVTFVHNEPYIFDDHLTKNGLVLCQKRVEKQGQIPPYSPHLALTAVTGVSERGRGIHVGCTIYPQFVLQSICISVDLGDINVEPSSLNQAFMISENV